ncbi:hypothetical protein DV702_12930 [Sporosarcina sp. PTS2304]|uniref:hypothetical protein n=1 Tax=Sporosarcina sp. PTS2304 TaxID=2283194 RepID=UPI000E0CE06C|nr:hypothetical protein [Sporosarcina sp. PTS2304]AXI00545.1 hypothetical protein DV702_12930 [Sporosarcina sp. PTS2304]
MRNRIVLSAISILIILGILVYGIGNRDDIQTATTEQTKVISKMNSSEGQWIILADDKKIYVENFSIWALIKENENYTIVYELKKNTKKYYLKKIVPEDYHGRF